MFRLGKFQYNFFFPNIDSDTQICVSANTGHQSDTSVWKNSPLHISFNFAV